MKKAKSKKPVAKARTKVKAKASTRSARSARTGSRPAGAGGRSAVRLGEYDALAKKVDAFFRRVHGRYRAEMQCGEGCSECCGHHLTISVVEAESMRQVLATRDAATRQRLASRAAALGDGEGPCPALEDDGRCGVYEGRPLVCRSHGAPMYVGSASLPVLKEGDPPEEGDAIKCCHLNFPERQLDQVDPDCVLDLVNMAATLAVVNARASGPLPAARRPLRGIRKGRPAADGQSAALRRVLIGDVLRDAHLR